ncbi:MAG: heparinase II/III-family protein [Planctomycetaceae bacterium]|nr:heparinase II/III-family protein [Planctomycetaceae bacterium]
MFLICCFFVFVTFIFSGNFVMAAELDLQFPAKLSEHPRLFLTKEREMEIKELVKTDPFLDRQVKELLNKADRVKQEPLTDYRIPDGKRLLAQSRRSIDRTTTLAFAYRMTGNKEYADVAIEEMLAVCRFKDWNPSHYLDTAEMATAVGIGYDWLYSVIPVDKRTEIKNAILKHALETGLSAYENQGWWTKSHHNWNEVCNAGLTIGALAIADEEPQIAKKIVTAAVKCLPNGLDAYKPDGTYPEGPSYWAYGASFTGLMLVALRDVWGNDFDLLKAEGFNVTGDFYMGNISPNYRTFNYADGGDNADPTPMMYMLSHAYNRSDYAFWLRRFLERKNQFSRGRFAVFHAIWYNPKGTEIDFAKTPLAQKYRGMQDICTMRTSWSDPNAAFLGFKAGNNRANHGHLDIGSFIYEVNGIRWAVDLGSDDYNMIGYFGKQRWDYYRLNNKSHNTLVIGNELQNRSANCKIIEFESGGNDGQFIARAVADITDAYKGQTQSAKRTVTLQKDGSVVIEDELVGVIEPVRWGMMTGATITIDGKTATLSQNKKQLRVELASNEAKQFEIIPATPPTEREKQNKNFSMLTTIATPKNGNISIRVTMTPIMLKLL